MQAERVLQVWNLSDIRGITSVSSGYVCATFAFMRLVGLKQQSVNAAKAGRWYRTQETAKLTMLLLHPQL